MSASETPELDAAVQETAAFVEEARRNLACLLVRCPYRRPLFRPERARWPLLLVEDDQAVAEMAVVGLRRDCPNLETEVQSSVASATEAVRHRHFCGAVVDWRLGDETARELVLALNAADVPCVIWTAFPDSIKEPLAPIVLKGSGHEWSTLIRTVRHLTGRADCPNRTSP